MRSAHRLWASSEPFRLQRELKRRYTVLSRGHRHQQTSPSRVTVCRVIGNDLFPRHQPGHALSNLRIILSKEENPCGWRKLFILNRIVDQNLQSEAIRLIHSAGHDFAIIEFDPDAYRSLRYNPHLLGGLDYFTSPEFAAKDDFTSNRERLWACGDKIRYLMNVNGARNRGLTAGRETSDWILVLDGSCIITDHAMVTLQSNVDAAPFAPYLIIPMRRLTASYDSKSVDSSPSNQEEPQIAFHRDAVERFDENYPYGLRDKTTLLHRLGVPGPWDAWPKLDFYPESPVRSPDRHFYKHATAAVLRLRCRVSNSQIDPRCFQQVRYDARNIGIFRALQAVDRQYAAIDASVLPHIAGLTDDPALDNDPFRKLR